MIFPFVLLAVSLVVYIDQHPKLTSQMEIPKDLQTLCPYTKFCNLSALEDLPNQENKADRLEKPCCYPCSCDDDCGLHRNCCKSKFDRYKTDETLGTICKSLNTKELIGRNDEHFYIIDKCPGLLDSCKHLNTSIYGSFLPVFSRTNGMIYYNSFCASCHNQTDTSNFIPSLSCPYITDNGLDELFNAISGLNLNCFFDFLSSDSIDISSQRCYPKMITDCKFKHQKDLVNNCNSFNATFVSKSYWYQNVFCYLCSRMDRFPESKWSDEYTMCPVSRNGRFQGDSAITILIDKKTASSFEQTMIGTQNEKEVCFKNPVTSLKTCRPTLCPEGRFRVNGICRFLGENWYVRDLALFVKLTPMSGNLTLDDLEQVPEDQLTSPQREYLFRPTLKTWEMDLYYNLHQNGKNVRFLLATLFLRNRMVKPNSLLAHVGKILKEMWTLQINKKTFPLTAHMSKYRMYYLAGDKTNFVPFAFEDETSNASKIYIWTKNYLNKFGSNRLMITKLFLCNQVILEEGEFNHTDFFPENVVITSNAKVLGNAEFRFMSGLHELQNKIRVCLEDVFSDSKSNGCESRSLVASLVTSELSMAFSVMLFLYVGYGFRFLYEFDF